MADCLIPGSALGLLILLFRVEGYLSSMFVQARYRIYTSTLYSDESYPRVNLNQYKVNEMFPTPDVFTLLLALSTVIAPVTAHVRPVPRDGPEPRVAYEAPSKDHDLAKSLSSSSHNSPILPRQGGGITEGPCGADIATCAEGYCCSEAG